MNGEGSSRNAGRSLAALGMTRRRDFYQYDSTPALHEVRTSAIAALHAAPELAPELSLQFPVREVGEDVGHQAHEHADDNLGGVLFDHLLDLPAPADGGEFLQHAVVRCKGSCQRGDGAFGADAN